MVIKQGLEDSTAALEIQQRDGTVVHPTRVPSATVQSSQRYTLSFLSELYSSLQFSLCVCIYLSRFFQRILCPLGGLMHSLGLAQNQHTFNSHLNYFNLKPMWALNSED